MPLAGSKTALALISGGIDSPVAAWAMTRRGLDLYYVHFHSAPFTSSASQAKVRDLIRRLVIHQGRATLFRVPFGDLQQQLVRDAPAEPRIVLYRRFMLRIAERIAGQVGALALITGDSLGQVSSQTLGNLDTINRAASLPVLRPLIEMDKAEIIERALKSDSAAVLVADEDEAVAVADRVAAEHVSLAVADPERLLGRLRNGGEFFLGDQSPVATGDYYAGPSHCLPTGTTARFASGVSAYTFLRRSGTVFYRNGMPASAIENVARLAEADIDYLDAPIMRVGARDVPMPYNDALELEVIPSVERIAEAIRGVM